MSNQSRDASLNLQKRSSIAQSNHTVKPSGGKISAKRGRKMKKYSDDDESFDERFENEEYKEVSSTARKGGKVFNHIFKV